MTRASKILEKIKFNTSTDVKKLNDEDLMDYISFLDNVPPSSSNRDAHATALKNAEAELKKRGFTSA